MTAICSMTVAGAPAAPQAEQDVLAANVDASASPRDDFFQFANGAWLRRHPIPDDQSRWGIGNVASEEIYAELRRMSEEAAARPSARGSAARLIGDVWATGMDATTINEQGLSPLQPDLDRIDRIRSVGDFIEVVAILHTRNMLSDSYFVRQRVLFDDGVQEDENDSRRWRYVLSPGGLSMGRPAYVGTDSRSVALRSAFREYLVKTMARLHEGGGRAQAGADAVFEIETRLAAGFQPGNNTRRIELAELTALAPSIDWGGYFRRLGAAGIESVTVRQPRFFETLNSLLTAVPLDHWKDYLRFWLIKTNAPFLDDATFGEFFAFRSAFTGQTEPPPRWRRVVWQERNWLGLLLEPLFGEAYWSTSSLARYQKVGESIRQAFRQRIESATWLSDRTRNHALLKLARLKITIGPTKTSVDVSTMPMQRDSYVLNMIRSAEWFHEMEIRRLKAPGAGSDADLHPAAGGGDATYIATRNEALVPSPVRAPGWRDDDLDDAFVYGATALGHEIAHGFDSEGRFYDADGGKVDWWTAEDAAAFDTRAHVLVEQYSAFEPLDGLRVDGKSSLPENLADVAGLRVALDAFKQTAQFKSQDRIAGFTPLQRFFLAYAYSHAGHERREALATRLGNNSRYAPNRERVNGAVMNMPEFHEAFGVKAGDRMYRPESLRVSVW